MNEQEKAVLNELNEKMDEVNNLIGTLCSMDIVPEFEVISYNVMGQITPIIFIKFSAKKVDLWNPNEH